MTPDEAWEWASREAAKLVCESCAHGYTLHPEPPWDCPPEWDLTHEDPSGDCYPCRGEEEGLVSGYTIAVLLRDAYLMGQSDSD